ncbi:MobA/MobL family protein [Sphingomonas sp. PAMC 26617]|uniref:MobA/MobL family protein n=1 Tax=Sphingomonas sp. PAMC 26617 TaxID=1112216 RepID=UPI0018DEE8F1|nr:MobA/MobL family protein [Sphingomonas sp. PAMC 26617]
MAIARLKMKTGGTGKAGPHASYIFREGHYARDTTLERLDATETGNMPSWAQDNPVAFWRAADAHERVNGTTYREMEIALPRELSVEDRTALVRAFVAQEVGTAHAYQWAIHTPLSSSDGGEQPHVHLMFSERQVDGIERGPDQYFKRANSKAPERGGAKKGYGAHGGAWLSREDASEAMKALRGRWEGMANDHLARAGREERIDMRSYADRGIDITPAARLLPSAWRDDAQRSNVIAFRRAVGELVRAEEAGQAMLPDRDAQIIDLERERAKRAEVQREPVTLPERGSLMGAARGAMTPPAAATPEIPTPSVPAPPSPDVVIQQWTAAHQRQLVAVQVKARRVMGHAEGMERRHRGRVEDHRRQEPIAPKGLLMAFKQASYEAAKKAWDKVADSLWRRAQQLKQRVERLEDYLRPIDRYTLHHPGDALAHKKLEQQDPQLVKDHAQAVKAKTQEQTADQAMRKVKALEGIRKQRTKEKERGRDDHRGRGR